MYTMVYARACTHHGASTSLNMAAIYRSDEEEGGESARKRRTKRPSWANYSTRERDLQKPRNTTVDEEIGLHREERPPRGLFNVLTSRVCQRWKLLPCLSPL